MTYPILKAEDANVVARKLTDLLDANPSTTEIYEPSFGNLESLVAHREGGDWEGDRFLKNAQLFLMEVSEDKKNGSYSTAKLEEHFAEHIISQTEILSVKALQDPDFWRYLTLFPYRKYTMLRQGDFKKERFGGDGNTKMNRWTLIQGFLLGNRLIAGDDLAALSAYREARNKNGLGDEWVLDYFANNPVRRRWSSWPEAARAFIYATVSDSPLFDRSNEKRPTNDFGGLVGRESENVYFPALDQKELTEIFDDTKQRNLGRLFPEESSPET